MSAMGDVLRERTLEEIPRTFDREGVVYDSFANIYSVTALGGRTTINL
jgi:hypothetical protein